MVKKNAGLYPHQDSSETTYTKPIHFPFLKHQKNRGIRSLFSDNSWIFLLTSI